MRPSLKRLIGPSVTVRLLSFTRLAFFFLYHSLERSIFRNMLQHVPRLIETALLSVLESFHGSVPEHPAAFARYNVFPRSGAGSSSQSLYLRGLRGGLTTSRSEMAD